MIAKLKWQNAWEHLLACLAASGVSTRYHGIHLFCTAILTESSNQIIEVITWNQVNIHNKRETCFRPTPFSLATSF